MNGQGNVYDESLQSKTINVILDQSNIANIKNLGQEQISPLKLKKKSSSQAKSQSLSSLKRSRKIIKSALCGCLQNDDQSDEEQPKIKDKKFEKKKVEKVNTKKLGSYMQLWKDKSAHNKNDIEIIFDLLKNQIQEFEASIIKGNEKQHYIITNDLKVVYYNLQNKYLVKEDMIKSHHIQNNFSSVFSKNQNLTIIAASPDCKQYFLGFSNGNVHIIDAMKFQSSNLQLVYEKDWDENSVTEIIFYKKLLFVAHKNGLINIFKKQSIQAEENNGPNQLNNQKHYILQSFLKNGFQLDNLAVSENGKFLLGVQSIVPKLKNLNNQLDLKKIENSSSDSEISEIVQDENDQVYKKQAVIYKIPFDNSNSSPICKKFGEINNEIKKLFILQKQKVYIISDSMDGLDIFSLNDFEIEGHLKKMHQNIILDFILLDDQNTLISSGKDKRVKIWDLQNQTLLQMLPIQKQIYSTLGISQDQKYLVTGGKGQVVFWYINNWQKLCTLLLPIIENFNTSSLQFSQNDILLYAKNNFTNDIIYWQISDTSLSIEFGDEQIVRALMTFDNKYLITENSNGTTILWSISRRSILKVIAKNSGFKQEFNCTSDSKFIFFKIDDAQLVMFNLKEKKKEKIFHCNGEITFSSINSNNTNIFISTSNKILQIFNLDQIIHDEKAAKKKNILNLLTQNNKKAAQDQKYQKDTNLIGEFTFKYKYDNINDVEEQEFSPTFALSADDNIVIISVNGVSTLILNVSDPASPRILFKNYEEPIKSKVYFSMFNFQQNQSDTQSTIQQFKNIKSFTIDHSGDQVILVDGKKASVLQLIDTENNNEKALVKDMIGFQNQNDSMQQGLNILQGNNNNNDKNYRYRFIQVQILFKLSQEDDFHAYYVEKESLVLTKLNQQWSLWCTKNYDNWDRILDFEGDYQFMIGKNRMLIGLIDPNNQIKYISRKLLTDLSGKSEDFIYKAINQPETVQFLQDHLNKNTVNFSQSYKGLESKYKNKFLGFVKQISDLEKHHILKLGKIKRQKLIIGDKRFEEKLDYDEQRRILKQLYPKKLKKDEQLMNRSHFKQSIKITGPLNYLYPFILSEMVKDQRNILNYIDALKRNNINPFEINILHYFTYQNQIHCMNACLQYKIKYNRDKFENTPLTYALKRKSLKSIEQILSHATDQNNSEIIQSINQNELCQLIEQSPSQLVSFLEMTYKEIQEEVPVFGIINSQGLISQVPLYFQEDRLLFDKKDADQYYLDSQRLDKQGLPIIMQALQFKYNFTLGSKQSLEFHWALEKCKRQVFQCHSIQKIIQYKWQQFKMFAQLQFFIMLAYCIILILHLNHIDDQNYEIALVIFCAYFTIFQLVSIFSGDLQKMLQDFWSFFDLTFLILYIIYIIFQIGLKSLEHQKYLLAVLNLVSWLRCVSLLRGFKSTRMFIKQVVQIIVDLKSFMVVLIISVFTVSTTFTMLTNDPSEDDFSDEIDFCNYLYVVYEYVFQQFPTAYSPQYMLPVELPVNSSMSFPALFPLENDMLFQLVLHFFAQIFISLIMMNLVIAIINETFVKSMENNKQEDFKELNNMILFYEKLLFWRKNQGTAQYLHWLEYGDNQHEDEKVNEEESALEKELSQVNEKIDKVIEDNSKVLKRIETTEKYIIKLTEINQEMVNKKKNLDKNDTIEQDYNTIVSNKNKK